MQFPTMKFSLLDEDPDVRTCLLGFNIISLQKAWTCSRSKIRTRTKDVIGQLRVASTNTSFFSTWALHGRSQTLLGPLENSPHELEHFVCAVAGMREETASMVRSPVLSEQLPETVVTQTGRRACAAPIGSVLRGNSSIQGSKTIP